MRCLCRCSWNFWHDGPLPPSHPAHPTHRLQAAAALTSAPVPIQAAPRSTTRSTTDILDSILKTCPLVPLTAIPAGAHVAAHAADAEFPDVEDFARRFRHRAAGPTAAPSTIRPVSESATSPTVVEISLVDDTGGSVFVTDDELARRVKRVLAVVLPGCGFVLRVQTGLLDDVVELNRKVGR